MVSSPSNSRKSQTAESLAGGDEPLNVRGESTKGEQDDRSPRSPYDPIELAPGKDSRDGVRDAIFNQPASLQKK